MHIGCYQWHIHICPINSNVDQFRHLLFCRYSYIHLFKYCECIVQFELVCSRSANNFPFYFKENNSIVSLNKFLRVN